MAILLLLIPLSVLLVGTALYWFVWAVDNHQFSDTEKFAIQALNDEPPESANTKSDGQVQLPSRPGEQQ